MKTKNCIVVICSILILVSIGLGISIIYSDYYFNPTHGLQSFTVADASRVYVHPEEDTGTPSSATSAKEMYVLIERWALDTKATIIYKNAFSAGCGIFAGSNWMLESLGLSFPRNEEGVFISMDAAFAKAYVSDGRFLPETLDLPVLGVYQEEDTPAVILNAGFLYPLSMATQSDGMYFTDSNDMSRLIELFESNGYMIIDQRQQLSIPELVAKLLTDSFLSRAVTFAMIGLIFCFSYMVLALYKENVRRIWIYHMFGLSKTHLFLICSIASVGISMIAAFLFGVILHQGLTYMQDSDLRLLTTGITVGFISFSLIINWTGYYRIIKRFNMGRK